MKRIIKKIGKILIIYVVLSMTILGGISQGYTSAEVGSAVAGYALNLLQWGNKPENYCEDNSHNSGYGPALRYSQAYRGEHPLNNTDSSGQPWFYDCSSFTAAMFNIVCKQQIFDWGASTVNFNRWIF